MRPRSAILWSAVAGAALLLLADAPAAPRLTPRHPSPGARGAGAPGQAGMIVAIDPETGRIGPASAAQRAELQGFVDETVSRSEEGLVEVHHPDGSVSIDLQGRFQDYTLAHLGPDGRLSFRCLDDRAAVQRALASPPVAPAALEER